MRRRGEPSQAMAMASDFWHFERHSNATHFEM